MKRPAITWVQPLAVPFALHDPYVEDLEVSFPLFLDSKSASERGRQLYRDINLSSIRWPSVIQPEMVDATRVPAPAIASLSRIVRKAETHHLDVSIFVHLPSQNVNAQDISVDPIGVSPNEIARAAILDNESDADKQDDVESVNMAIHLPERPDLIEPPKSLPLRTLRDIRVAADERRFEHDRFLLPVPLKPGMVFEVTEFSGPLDLSDAVGRFCPDNPTQGVLFGTMHPEEAVYIPAGTIVAMGHIVDESTVAQERVILNYTGTINSEKHANRNTVCIDVHVSDNNTGDSEEECEDTAVTSTEIK